MHAERLDIGPLSILSYPHAWRALCSLRGCKSWLICIDFGNKALNDPLKIINRNRLKAYFMQRNVNIQRNTSSFANTCSVAATINRYNAKRQDKVWPSPRLSPRRQILYAQPHNRKHACSWLILGYGDQLSVCSNSAVVPRALPAKLFRGHSHSLYVPTSYAAGQAQNINVRETKRESKTIARNHWYKDPLAEHEGATLPSLSN